MGASLLTAQSVVVRYGATTAADHVDFDIQRGEVHALVGENGAGKSTLLRAVAGVVRLTAGSITAEVGARLAWVPQETVLPPDLTVAEWIFLGCELRGRLGRLHTRAMHDGAAAALHQIGCQVAPRARLGALAVPQRKQVQLARALRDAPDLLLLDEPTAVLGDAETRQLFASIQRLRQSGAGILYVSHRLDEVLAIADRVTVLRDGRRVSTDPVSAVDVHALVHRMVGRDVPARRSAVRTAGAVALRLDGVSTAHVRNVSLTVRRGEVVGLAGLIGAGRSELLEAIARLRPLRAGTITGAQIPVLVPEDRSSKGLVPTLVLRENLFLPAAGRLIRRAFERREAGRWIAALHLHASSTEATIDSLSGGNQQKLLLARALRHQPELLLLDEPTAGVDVGAKAEIHALIGQLAERGAGIVLASSDLPELLALCDLIVALRGGAAVGLVAAADATEPRLAGLITGADSRESTVER